MRLTHVRDIEWFEGSILLVSRDEEGNLYLEKWADLARNIVVRTTEDRIVAYESGNLSMLDLLKSDGDRGWISTYHPEEDRFTFEECVISQVKSSYLPKPDAMYDPDLKPR